MHADDVVAFALPVIALDDDGDFLLEMHDRGLRRGEAETLRELERDVKRIAHRGKADEIRQLVLDRASSKEIKTQSMKQGMLTLRMCAVRKLLSGATTVEEMLRVTQAD